MDKTVKRIYNTAYSIRGYDRPWEVRAKKIKELYHNCILRPALRKGAMMLELSDEGREQEFYEGLHESIR